jgi:hypothetical protein
MKILLVILSAYLLFYSVYWFILTLFGLSTARSKQCIHNPSNPELLLVLPAYKPSKLFYQVLDSTALAIAGRNIKVLILFQDCKDKQLMEYAKSMRFLVEEKSFNAQKGNTYQQALKHITTLLIEGRRKAIFNPEFVMLVDKDNLLSKDFFRSIPLSYYERFDIIQGKRKAIASASAIALFDTISELLNDMLFRRAKARLGGMIEISGSGALIETDLFIRTVNKLDARAPGFDKNFMANLLTSKREIRTIYHSESVLFEEKTAELAAYNPQRIRWFGEQYYNAIYKAKDLIKATLRYKRLAALDYLITLCRPPRSIQVLVAPLLAGAEMGWYIYAHEWYLGIPVCSISFLIITISISIFLLSERLLIQAIRNSLQLPSLAWNNFFNAAKSLKKENLGKFIHTVHKL